jgi:hypothetical protein
MNTLWPHNRIIVLKKSWYTINIVTKWLDHIQYQLTARLIVWALFIGENNSHKSNVLFHCSTPDSSAPMILLLCFPSNWVCFVRATILTCSAARPNNGMGVFRTLECLSKEPELEAYLERSVISVFLVTVLQNQHLKISKNIRQKHKSSNHFTKSGLCSRGGVREAESGTVGRVGRDESKVALGGETWGG